MHARARQQAGRLQPVLMQQQSLGRLVWCTGSRSSLLTVLPNFVSAAQHHNRSHLPPVVVRASDNTSSKICKPHMQQQQWQPL
jgi:hypothetical protein